MKEQDIIELLLQRNEKGMDALLLHYGPLMRYIIAPILQNSQDQEDCLSEVAMRVWKKIEQFNQERGSWKTWLTAITRNAALNYTRDTHRHNSVEEIPDDTPSPEPSPEEMIIQKADELVSLVNNIIINDKKDIDYIDGSNHSYDGKEELVAKQIIEFINK